GRRVAVAAVTLSSARIAQICVPEQRSVAGYGVAEDHGGGHDDVARGEVLGRGGGGLGVAAVAGGARLFRVDVLDVQDRADADAGGLGVQVGLRASGGDGLAPGLGPQLALGDDVEVDALDLVGASRDDVDEQRLDVVQRAGPDR